MMGLLLLIGGIVAGWHFGRGYQLRQDNPRPKPPDHHPHMSRFEFDLLPSGQYFDFRISKDKNIEDLPACPDCGLRTTHPAEFGPCDCPWPPIFGRRDAHIMKNHHTCPAGTKRKDPNNGTATENL